MPHLIGHESSRWVIGIALLFGASRNCFAENHKIMRIILEMKSLQLLAMSRVSKNGV